MHVPHARFAAEMLHYPDFSWEPLDVNTEDGYQLTMFHVWLDENGE